MRFEQEYLIRTMLIQTFRLQMRSLMLAHQKDSQRRYETVQMVMLALCECQIGSWVG